MKIIQLIYSLSSGGAERFVVNLSNELIRQGHDVTICMLREDTEPMLTFNKIFLRQEIKFCSLNFNLGFSFKKVALVEAFIKEHNPEVVHCHLNVIPYIFRLSFCNRNIKFVHTIHNIASKAAGSKKQYYLNKLFYRSKIIQPVTISKECNKSYVDFYHLNNSVCIDNGCPSVYSSDLLSIVALEIESYKTCLNTPVFIHIARCFPQKNQQLLIDVFNKLNDEGVDYTLLVIGNGFFEEKNRILVDNACDKIHFLGEKNNIGDYLLCANAFCLTSVYEGLPISLIEAMSCGVPSICTPVGGIPDVVIDGITGFLSKNLTAESYIEAIKVFLKSRIQSDVIIDEYKKRFSIVKCTEKYLSVYEDI